MTKRKTTSACVDCVTKTDIKDFFVAVFAGLMILAFAALVIGGAYYIGSEEGRTAGYNAGYDAGSENAKLVYGSHHTIAYWVPSDAPERRAR